MMTPFNLHYAFLTGEQVSIRGHKPENAEKSTMNRFFEEKKAILSLGDSGTTSNVSGPS